MVVLSDKRVACLGSKTDDKEPSTAKTSGESSQHWSRPVPPLPTCQRLSPLRGTEAQDRSHSIASQVLPCGQSSLMLMEGPIHRFWNSQLHPLLVIQPHDHPYTN